LWEEYQRQRKEKASVQPCGLVPAGVQPPLASEEQMKAYFSGYNPFAAAVETIQSRNLNALAAGVVSPLRDAMAQAGVVPAFRAIQENVTSGILGAVQAGSPIDYLARMAEANQQSFTQIQNAFQQPQQWGASPAVVSSGAPTISVTPYVPPQAESRLVQDLREEIQQLRQMRLQLEAKVARQRRSLKRLRGAEKRAREAEVRAEDATKKNGALQKAVEIMAVAFEEERTEIRFEPRDE